MKSYFLILSILLSFVPAFAIEVTEVRYDGAEFVEIYSEDFLNLSNSKIYDELGESRFNTLELYKSSNSSLYLIVGSKFISEVNTSDLNCTIYNTDKSQVSNGGLRDSGESFIIQVNSTLNLSVNNGDVPFNNSPCAHTFVISDNSTNTSNTTIVLPDSCNHNFGIVTDEDFFENKIQFSFVISEPDNFTIQYWVSHLNGTVARNEINTSNTNKKSFTPKGSAQLYNISARSYFKNCTSYDSKLVGFITTETEQSEKEVVPSYIQIENEEELSFLEESTLKFRVYRNATETKSSVKVYLNSKVQESFSVKKDSLIRESVDLEFEEGFNTIEIQGLGLSKQLFVNNKREFFQYVEQIIIEDDTNRVVELLDPILNRQKLLVSLYTSENISGDCVVYEQRTQVSNRTNLTVNSIFEMDINNDKVLQGNGSLRLLCRYRFSNQSTLRYIEQNFTYLRIPENGTATTEVYDELDRYLFSNVSFREEFSREVISREENLSDEYISKNVEQKNNSPYYLILGLVSTFIPLFMRKEL